MTKIGMTLKVLCAGSDGERYKGEGGGSGW